LGRGGFDLTLSSNNETKVHKPAPTNQAQLTIDNCFVLWYIFAPPELQENFVLVLLIVKIWYTLAMENMGGMAKQMPKVFALFTAGAMASLALPGMSGFVGECSLWITIQG